MEPEFLSKSFWVVSFRPFFTKFTHNVKSNKYFQIASKTEKHQKWRYKVFFRQQRYTVTLKGLDVITVLQGLFAHFSKRRFYKGSLVKGMVQFRSMVKWFFGSMENVLYVFEKVFRLSQPDCAIKLLNSHRLN